MYTTNNGNNLNTPEDTSCEFRTAIVEGAQDVRAELSRAASDAREMLEKEIRSRPVHASAVALGIGFVLGALLKR